MQRFLLSHTATSEHHIEIGTDGVKLTQQVQFELSNEATSTLEWFLQKVKDDKAVRHSYTDANWHLDFDPAGSDLTSFFIAHRATGRQITMTLSTAYKLLDALSGKTERLVKLERRIKELESDRE